MFEEHVTCPTINVSKGSREAGTTYRKFLTTSGYIWGFSSVSTLVSSPDGVDEICGD